MAYLTRDQRHMEPSRVVILPFLHERKLYINKMESHHKYFYFTITATDKKLASREKVSKRNLMVCMDITSMTYRVYTERGILINEFSFKHLCEQYGKPLTVSSNGRVFLFKKPEEKSTVHVLCLTSKELIYMKTINVKDDIIEYGRHIDEHEGTQTVEDLMEAFENNFDEKNSVFSFSINDKLDVVV